MIDNKDHIDQLIRDKFDSFEPALPPHIWQGVVSGLEAHEKAASFRRKGIITISSAALVLLMLGWFFLYPVKDSNQESDQALQVMPNTNLTGNITSENTVANDISSSVTSSQNTTQIGIIEPTDAIEPSLVDTELPAATGQQEILISSLSGEIATANEQADLLNADLSGIAHMSLRRLNLLFFNNLTPSLLSVNKFSGLNKFEEADKKKEGKSPFKRPHKWSFFIGLSPEFITTSFDSVTILNSYSLNFEPVYHLNNHLFVRFGLGVSYARDRGFAKLDYISNQYMGSYNDVYNVTFDSVGDLVVPTYYTKTVEVWDSIRHLVISEVTNLYVYAQIPVMIGYSHQGKRSPLKWYIYGGPAFNIQVGKSIDEPHPYEKDVEIINLQNKLPERNTTYFQLWLGAGIEYKLSDQVSMAVEPGYRHYFNSLYNKQGYNKPVSAFSLKVGAIIRIN